VGNFDHLGSSQQQATGNFLPFTEKAYYATGIGLSRILNHFWKEYYMVIGIHSMINNNIDVKIYIHYILVKISK
jgi:hypothetical protein